MPRSELVSGKKNILTFEKIGSVTAEILKTLSFGGGCLGGGEGVECKVIFMSNPT